MLRQITSVQLLEWLAFSRLEPFGDVREDYRMANAMQLLANVNRDSKTKPEPFKLTDFLLKFDDDDEAPKRQTWQEQKRIAHMFAALYNAEAKRK